MRKILSVLLVLCMLMTLTPAAAITSFAEEVLEIPTVEEVSEEDLVEIFGEGEEVELLANVTAAFVPAEGDGVTYFSEFDGESITNEGSKEGSETTLVDGKYTTAADNSLWEANGQPAGFMGFPNKNIITIDMGAAKTFSGIRIYDSARARYHNARKVKTISLSVSSDGVLWYALDNATNEDFTTTYRDFAFKKGSAVNVEARYLQFKVTAVNSWGEWEAEEIVLLDAVGTNNTLDADDFAATNVAGVTAKALIPAEGDGVTYLTELTGAVVTKTAGSVQGRLESVYNGIYTEGLMTGASTNADFDVFPVVSGSTEGAMGWYTGDATHATVLRVDLGDVKTFSGIRLMDDHKARGMKARKATKLEVFVSESGEKWGQLDDAITTRTTEVTPQYGDFKFAIEGVAKNVEARYIEFRVTGVNAHGQFDIEEIVMLDADETLDTLTAEDYDPEIAEAKRDYYRQREWFTASSMDAGDWKPVGNLFDGIWQAPDHTGDDGNYWHTATGLTADKRGVIITFTEAQKIGGFRFYPRVDNPRGNPSYVTVFASEDGTTFKEIKASTHIMDSAMAKPVELVVQTGVAYKALKIRVDKNANGADNNHTCFCELQVLKPKKGYAYEEDVLYLETTPTVTAGSTQGAGMVTDRGLFDGVVHQFANEAEGYYNPYIGTASADPHFEMDNILKVAGDKAWMIVDLGKEYTFSGARLFGRWNQPGQSLTEGTLYVSDNGTDWTALDAHADTYTRVSKTFDESLGVPANGCQMAKYASTNDAYTEMAVKVKGAAYNAKARYIKIEVTKTGGAHWSVQELLLVKADAANETKTVSELKEIATGVVDDGLDYYNPSVYFESMEAGSEWQTTTPVTKAFDGITDNVKADGTFGADDNWNYWHSTATTPVSEAQRTITVMFKNPINVGGFRVYGRHDTTNGVRQYGGNPGTVRIEATYDGENWFKATNSVSTGLSGEKDNDPATDEGVWCGTNLLNGELDNKFKGIRYVVEKNVSGSATAHTNVVELQILKATTYESPFEADDFAAYPAWTITSGSDAGKTMANLGFLTDGIRPATNTFQHSEMNNAIYPAENKAGWLIVDLGEEQSFSGVRVYPRMTNEGKAWATQTISKGYLYVSDNGTDWVQAELSTDLNTTTGIFNATALADDEVRNVKARYVKVAATQTGLADSNQHWSATELRLIKPVSGKDALTVSAFAELLEEEVLEGYYTNAADWTWTAGSQYSNSHGVDKLYDGVVYGDMGNCWHSAVDGDKSVTIMFDKDTEVGGVRVFPRTVDGGATANTIKMQGTYDGNTWVDILPETKLGFTANKQEYKEAYLLQGRDNNTFKGIKFIVVKDINGGTSYTNITELQVLTPVAPKVTFPEDEVEMGYPVGIAATYIVKAGAADAVKHDTTRGKIIMDGDYITHEEFVALGAPGHGVSSRQLQHDYCIGGQNGDSVYLYYDLGKTYEFSGIRLYQRVGGNQNLKEGYIYVSEDGETWVTADKLFGASAVISSFNELKFGGTAYNVKARHIKVHCTKSWAGTPGHWALEEVRLISANSANETKTPTEITTALAAKAEAVETLIAAIGTVTLESKDAIKAARTAYDALSPAVKTSVDNYDVLVAAEAAYLALAGDALAGQVDELVISELTADDADMIAEMKAVYESLDDAAKAEIDSAKLEKAIAVVEGLSKTINPTVIDASATSGKMGYGTLNYTLYTEGNDVTVTGITYKGEAVTNEFDQWKAVTNGDGTISLTLGGNYYKSETHRKWLYQSTTLSSIKSHEDGGNYFKLKAAINALGLAADTELTEDTFNGFFVRELTNEGMGKKVLTVSLSDGTTKDIVLNVVYNWSTIAGALSADDADGLAPTPSWKVTTNNAAPLSHAAGNWFNGNYGDATNSQSYTANYYDAAGVAQKKEHIVRAAGPYKVWVDFGSATKFGGVKLNGKNYNLTNVKVYGSNDFTSWTLLKGISGNNSKTANIGFENNETYRYVRIDIDEYQSMASGSFLFLNEIVFIAPATRILGGAMAIDISDEVEDIVRSFNADNEYAIESVKVGDTELTADVDYVLDGTKGITFKTSWLETLEVGEYKVAISFASGEVVEAPLTVNDLSVVNYWLSRENDPAASQAVKLINAKGYTVKSVAVEGGSDVEFTQDGTEIAITRTNFRRAINNIPFEKLPADDTKAYGQKLIVTFEDDTTKTYTVNIYSEWDKFDGELTAEFAADEVAINTSWAARTDSANHYISWPFIKKAKGVQHDQNWHSYHSDGAGDAPSGGVHYVDIDMGEAVKEIGGIRYVSRANGADWGTVTISGSDDYATWTQLYTGKASGAAGTYNLKFTENGSFRYYRIKMSGINHTTADCIRFLKPALAVLSDAAVKKDVKANDEEIEIKLEDLGDATISKITLGTIALAASDYEYDAETDVITIKASGLNKITAEGDVVLAIETSSGKVGSITVKYMDFSKKMFAQEVTPYHFDHEAKLITGIISGNMSAMTDRQITTKADGTALKNTDYETTEIKTAPFALIYSPSGTSTKWNSAPGYFEIDYKRNHEFSAVRVYHRIWADKGVRQYFTTMTEGYIEVSNDGINWLKSDVQTFGKGNLDSNDYNRNVSDDIKFIVDGTAYNVSARYVRVHATKNGAREPLGVEEICLYEPLSSNATLKPATITPEAAIFSLAEIKDLELEVEWNDSVGLNTISIVAEEDGEEILVPINSGYYFSEDDKIVLSKYFFVDGGYRAGDVIELSIGFAVGEDVVVPVTIAEAEEYKINYTAGENGTLKAVVRSTDMITGEAVEEEVASGSLVGRHENLVFVAEGNEGYEAKEWTLTGKGADTVTYERVTDYKDWTFVAINAKEPVARAFDKNDKTYWHSDYETKTTGSPNPTHLLSDGPYWITAIFDEPMMISEMAHTRRINSDGTAYDAGQKARKYKVWGTTDGGATFDVLLAEGDFVKADITDIIALNDVGYIDGVKFEIYSTFASATKSHCSIGEITFTEKHITENHLSGGVTYTGSASQEFEIDSLFADATVTVEFAPVKKGVAIVETDLKRIEAEVENSKVTFGEKAEITLTPAEGEELPEEITVIMEGLELKEGQDYTYDSTTGEVVVKNVKGDIKILAVAKGVEIYTVTYADENGATGKLPEAALYTEGDTFKLPKNTLKLTGSTFEGWKCSANDKVYAAGTKFTMLAEDVTFTAVWEGKEKDDEDEGTKRPSVGGGSSSGSGGSFSGGAASVSTVVTVNLVGYSEIKVNKGSIVADPAAKEGYDFMGWFLDAAFTVPYANNGVTENVTLYPYFRRVRNASELKDMQGHWAENTVGEMYVGYFINGTADGKFEPDKKITRAEFCQILYLMSGQTTDGAHNFTDVNVGDWFAGAVAWAVKSGITNGTTETTFAPYENITREQMATMIYRYATLMGHDWTITKEAGFADQAEVAEYANYQVNWAADKKIINGYPDGTFAPKSNATKAEAVTMLQRLLNLGK